MVQEYNKKSRYRRAKWSIVCQLGLVHALIMAVLLEVAYCRFHGFHVALLISSGLFLTVAWGYYPRIGTDWFLPRGPELEKLREDTQEEREYRAYRRKVIGRVQLTIIVLMFLADLVLFYIWLGGVIPW